MRGVLGLTVLACAACSGEPADDDVREEQAIAAVEAANEVQPPLEQVTPEPLLGSDIERHDIYGPSCAYAPGINLGPRLIAREPDAFMKVDGEILRFAADPGSRELAEGTRSLYNGREYSLRLELEEEDLPIDAEPGSEMTEYEGTVRLLDRWGREVYSGTGPSVCGYRRR